jgi:hypothetical protein
MRIDINQMSCVMTVGVLALLDVENDTALGLIAIDFVHLDVRSASNVLEEK